MTTLAAASAAPVDARRERGALRGLAPRLRRWRPARRPADTTVLAVLVMLAGQALVLADLDVPVLRPLLAAALLVGVPVLVLARRAFARVPDPLPRVLYAIGTTALGLIVVPLGLNTVLPWFGVGAPLARTVLVVASAVVDTVLLLVPSRTPLAVPARLRAALRAGLRARLDAAVVLAVGAVVLAVAGAVRLNNGLGGTVATLAHAVAVAAFAAALVRDRRASAVPARDAAVVYLAGLALLLGTSLRGWFVTGHDIQQEYLAFLYTHDAGHWVMSAYPSPYNACLSVNILPSVLVEYLGVGGVFVFKVVLQLVFALVPVCVYVAARRTVPRRMAMLAPAVFALFPTFYTDMPFLTRQETAYLFLALVLLGATQRGWSVRVRRRLVLAFGVGVVLSHYSTTYVLVITLILGLLGTAAGALWRRRAEPRLQRRAAGRDRRAAERPTGRHEQSVGERRRLLRSPAPRRPTPAVLLHPLLVLALAATAWAWSSPATHSGGHLADTVDKLTETLISGNPVAGSSDLKYSVFGGGGPTPAQRFAGYVKLASDARGTAHPGLYVFPRPSGNVLLPPLVEREYLPLTAAGRAVDGAGLNVRGVNALLRTGAAGLLQLFLVLGLLALALRARSTRRITREQFWLVAGSIGALATVVVVPGVSADYGVLRAFQQTLLFAAPLVAVGVFAVASRVVRRRRRPTLVLVAGVVAAMGLVLTGAQPALLGGYYAQLSQSDSGQYYDLLYARTPQLAAARWLAADTRGRGLNTVAAADIVSVTRLQMFLPRSVTVTGNYLPLQLTKDTYVFLGPQQSTRGQSTVFFTGDLLTYRYPRDAVGGRLDLVYSTAGTRIYR
ncbi:Predicted membrane protein [Jatrophihabitans endophyticus]|uniref:Predicted membrane protein n=1 Tax=Jatrophihabitans endophyticus TaxID=1206085 RepID=A0A1M5C323_9ACTN|nr:DUF2206 domain-containing protein [Jatrophihabitans endophyticus]SHF49070.1 Predicted membrane protein [Jatrophihabitans endophyticus]